MKYWEVLRTSKRHSPLPLADNETIDIPEYKLSVPGIEMPDSVVISNQEDDAPGVVYLGSPNVNALISHMSKLAEESQMTIPEDLKDTELNDDEAGEVIGTLLKYQEKFFSSIPLEKTHVQKFIFNIPREVYEDHIYCEDYMLPPLADPLFWFYMFCTERHDTGEFVASVFEMIKNNPEWEDWITDYHNSDSEEEEDVPPEDEYDESEE